MPKKVQNEDHINKEQFNCDIPENQNQNQIYQQFNNDFYKISKKANRKNTGRWTRQQDSRLTKLVQKYGYKWSLIGKHMKDKRGKSCRERWLNNLDPRISWKKMNIYEQWLLFIGWKTFGSQWAEIAKLFSDRTDNQLKNHWHTQTMACKLNSFEKQLSEIIMKRQLRQIAQEVLFGTNS